MNKIITILVCFVVSGCMPIAFSGATFVAVSSAKSKTMGETMDDIGIAIKINTILMQKKLNNKVNVEVSQGRVLLTGTVNSEEDVIYIIDKTWQQNGVKEVNNEITVDSLISNFNIAQYTKDTWITTRVKTRTMMEDNIKFINYTVITVNNIVYIFGIAKSNKELNKVANLAATVKGVEKVVSYARIKE